MSVEVMDTSGGIVTIKVAGKLAQPEMARAQQQAIEYFKPEDLAKARAWLAEKP